MSTDAPSHALQFLVLHKRPFGDWAIDGDRYDVHGAMKPTLFRTYRNAIKTVRDGATWVRRIKNPPLEGKIVVFDPTILPEVTEDAVFLHRGLADRITDREFCERQMQLWAERAAKARS